MDVLDELRRLIGEQTKALGHRLSDAGAMRCTSRAQLIKELIDGIKQNGFGGE